MQELQNISTCRGGTCVQIIGAAVFLLTVASHSGILKPRFPHHPSANVNSIRTFFLKLPFFKKIKNKKIVLLLSQGNM